MLLLYRLQLQRGSSCRRW